MIYRKQDLIVLDTVGLFLWFSLFTWLDIWRRLWSIFSLKFASSQHRRQILCLSLTLPGHYCTVLAGYLCSEKPDCGCIARLHRICASRRCLSVCICLECNGGRSKAALCPCWAQEQSCRFCWLLLGAQETEGKCWKHVNQTRYSTTITSLSGNNPPRVEKWALGQVGRQARVQRPSTHFSNMKGHIYKTAIAPSHSEVISVE